MKKNETDEGWSQFYHLFTKSEHEKVTNEFLTIGKKNQTTWEEKIQPEKYSASITFSEIIPIQFFVQIEQNIDRNEWF